MKNASSKILAAVIRDLKSTQSDADRAQYDRTVRTYFPAAHYSEMMAVRTHGSDAIESAARRLY